MQNCYIISREILDDLTRIISAKFKNFAVFEVNFSQDERELIKKGLDKEPILALISRFEKASEGREFLIIAGCEGIGLIGKTELNLKIARHLNSPVFERENLNELRAINANSKLLVTDDVSEILASSQNIITPYRFEKILLQRAREAGSSVILPESDDERILKAAQILLAQGAVKIILLGDAGEIDKRARNLGVNLSGAQIIDPKTDPRGEEFAQILYEARRAKGMSLEQARILARDKVYFATLAVASGAAGAVVSGATMSTADTIRPALQIIKTKPNAKLVSGLFFMALEEETLAYADCAVTPNPGADELASIAVTSAQTAKAFGIEPRVAMLSYSTADSGSGADVDFALEAAAKALEIAPELKIAAPIQYDAASVPSVGAKKMPDSEVAGRANVFIFPNLNCGNICYKAVQRSANAVAIGPILQGLKKPVNDLSRGCEVADIVNTVLISAIQAKAE